MNLSLKRFQIFRVGTHRDSKGRRRQFSAQMLKDIADEHNSRTNGRAALFIGHGEYREIGKFPKGLKPLGLVHELEFDGKNLYANAFITAELLSMVRKGMYRHVSAGFDPFPSGLKLNHIAFLNNPAVKGMEPLNFSEISTPYITFEMDIDFFESKLPIFQNESQKLDYLAREYQKQHPDVTYYQAVKACIHLTNYR